MAKRFNSDDSGDSQELQALFDSIATQAPARPHLETVGGTASSGDSEELEDLFDTIARQRSQATISQESKVAAGCAAPSTDLAAAAESEHAAHNCESVFNRLGHMTRELHDTLRALGYDHALEEAAKAIPDARQRLAYIGQMTEQAASRVLNATDIAKPIQDDLKARSTALNGRWERLYGGDLSVTEFKALAHDTRAFLGEVPKQAGATGDQLMEIMMAQDFQDLTGQVIKKVVELAQSLETQLLEVLIEAMPDQKRIEAPDGLLNGPVMNAEGRTDVAVNQEQVDDLLDSLGF